MTTAVVCDDDSALRSGISELCEAAGLQVVAETDRGGDALELVRRFQVDVLVLDYFLIDGSGESALLGARDEAHRPVVIVFTLNVNDAVAMRHLGAHEVVEKPDLDRLEHVLREVASDIEQVQARAAQDRRRSSESRPADPDLWRPPTEVISNSSLLDTAAHTATGDSVLVVTLFTAEGRPTPAGTGAECGLGEMLRATVRLQDVVHELPDVDGFVAVLRSGDEHAAEAVWNRMEDRVRDAGVPHLLTGAWTRVDPLGTMAAVDRASIAVARTSATGLQAV